jgi:hypothetical protein
VSQHTIVLDLDGTLVENHWPDLGDWMPGAIEEIGRLHATGKFHFKLFSARLSPYTPWGVPREEYLVAAELRAVRDKLDSAGLTFVDIWRLPGKPGGDVYVDDKAERYHGRPGSWKALADKLITRFTDLDPEFPPFNQEEV